MDRPILSLENISKSYPGVAALSGVDLELFPGEVLGLIGENGAGKSTLIKIVTGANQPDSGKIVFNGSEIVHADPSAVIHAGISAIYQEFSLFPEMTVTDNLFYGRELRRGPFLDRKRMAKEASKLLARIGADINPATLVKDLSVGHQQLVELAKAMSRQAKVLIMDEPTAPLTNREVEHLYAAVRKLVSEGVAIIYVSHRLEEIFDLCNRVMVLRDGKHIETQPTAQLDRDRLIELMVGRTLVDEFPPSTVEHGEVTIEVRDLQSSQVHGVSFSVKKGEILGLGGLVGAGRTETARLIFGADPRTNGEIIVHGKKEQIGTPADAIGLGIGLIPEDRKHHGGILAQTIRFNVIYATLNKFSKWGFVRTTRERTAVEAISRTLGVKAPSMEKRLGELSGGNQQKVILAKWLETNADILIFDEPTRGIDVGAKHEIYKLMRSLSEQGKTIIMISSEMPELLGMSDRIVVLREGRSVETIEKHQFSQEKVLRLASGMIATATN